MRRIRRCRPPKKRLPASVASSSGGADAPACYHHHARQVAPRRVSCFDLATRRGKGALMGAIPLHHEEIEYPTSDGQPMAETEIHYDVMTELIAALRRRYRDVPDVWVGGNLFLCYEEGNPRAAVAPDVVM